MSDEVDPKEVAARFASIPRMPVIQLDNKTTLKLAAILPPAHRGGDPKGWCLVGRVTAEGNEEELFAIETDQETAEILARSFEEAARELREVTKDARKGRSIGRDGL